MAAKPIRLLFLDLHREGRSPSQRFRYEQYLDYLRNNGFAVTHHPLLNAAQDKVFYQPGNFLPKAAILLQSLWKRTWDVLQASQYDIVFVQREAIMLGTSFFEKQLKRRGLKLVFDFDDSIWLQNVSEANRALAFLKDANKTAELIRASDLVFAGNAYLADYARQHNQRVEIVPTTIDTEAYRRIDTPRNPDQVVIGWSGSVTTIQHFRYALPALTRIKALYGDQVVIHVIGDGNFREPNLNIQGQAWNLNTEVQDLSTFDIGIMPLPDDEWAKGKCGLKGLQYMALEIPTLMSPVGVNSDIIQDGVNGFLPRSEDDWVSALSRLIEDPGLRARTGAAARQTVIDKYSVLSQRDRYVQLLSSLA